MGRRRRLGDPKNRWAAQIRFSDETSMNVQPENTKRYCKICKEYFVNWGRGLMLYTNCATYIYPTPQSPSFSLNSPPSHPHPPHPITVGLQPSYSASHSNCTAQ